MLYLAQLSYDTSVTHGRMTDNNHTKSSTVTQVRSGENGKITGDQNGLPVRTVSQTYDLLIVSPTLYCYTIKPYLIKKRLVG